MAYNARWYTEEGNLRSIGRDHLRLLLDHYSKDLKAEGIEIEEPEDDDAYYNALVGVFMRPAGIPNALHDALYFIKGLDNDRGEARLVKAVHEGRLKINLNGDRSTADKALLAWLADEKLVRALHLDVGLDASRSFLTLRVAPGRAPRIVAFDSVKDSIQDALAALFYKHSRAKWARITPHTRGKQSIFIVERTAPFRRETQHDNNGTKPLYYWPTEQDIVIYDEDFQDLRMNVTSKWQKDGYAELFGLHLFNDKSLFREAPKYSLTPILKRGRASLEASAYGIKEIRLAELSCKVNEFENDFRIRRAEDVFGAYEREGGIPQGEDLACAKFGVTFDDSATERTVTIQPPNRAKYMQDQHGARITAWMKAQGYIVDTNPEYRTVQANITIKNPPQQTVSLVMRS